MEAELAAIEAADGPDAADIGSDSRCALILFRVHSFQPNSDISTMASIKNNSS